MKTVWILTLNVGFFLAAPAQNYHAIDSLKQQLLNTTEYTIKGLAIWSLAREYVYTKPDSALYYTGLGLELTRDAVIKRRFENSNNPFLYSFETRMYSLSSSALAEQRNDSLAVRLGLKSLELAEKSKDKYDIERVYGGLSEMYQFIGEVGLAIDYMKKKLALDTSADERTNDKASLGACFYDAGQYDSALYYLKKIDPKYKLYGDRYWPMPHLYLAKAYTKKGEYEKAFYEYGITIDYAKQGYINIDLLNAYIGIAEAYKNIGKLDSALFYSQQALQIANQIVLPGQKLEASSLLSSLYEAKGLTDSAYKYAKLSLALKDSLFNTEKIKQVQNYTFSEKLRQQEMQQAQHELQNKIKLYSLLAALILFLVIAFVLYRNNRYKQKANVLLQQQKEKVESTLSELKATQAQLVQSEKMASLGELTAGIAHEIQNPLNFVNNFSEVNKELLVEMKDEIDKGNMSEVKAIADDVIGNQEKINLHGRRADAIVKGMLQHSRTSSGQKEITDINALVDEYVRLAYHGLRAKDKTFNVKFETNFDTSIGKINVVPQDIGRVLLNLINNAVYAVGEKQMQNISGYEPTVILSTKKQNGWVEINVMDNGNGIPQKVLGKIFQPFYTTKPTGQGTGLGLSLAYDIVKTHGGEVRVKTKENEGSEFIVQLPFV